MHYQFPNISIISNKISLTISFDKKNTEENSQV